jgi:FkbM family methyltransferase
LPEFHETSLHPLKLDRPRSQTAAETNWSGLVTVAHRTFVAPLFVRNAVKSLARKCGYDVSRISSVPFGRDVWFDIARLSECWGLSIRCIFDVGANVGQSSLAMLSHFPSAKVYAFEPYPGTFERLAEVLSGRQAEAFNIALTDQAGDAELFTYEADQINSLTPTSRFAVRFGKVGKPMSIRASTIDEFCCSHDIKTIDILKVDTEGCELEVLKGATETLKSRGIRFIYAEFNDICERAGRTGGALAPISALLESHGFRFVTCYTENVVSEGELFAVHNALFAASPSRMSE